jgi:putative heme-binding domain-containing protein
MAEILPDGSTFKTRDTGYAVTTTDKWFRPVDIKQGPDGAIYVADWYDRQVNHYRNHEGQVDASNGRIYRLKAKGAASAKYANQPDSPNKTSRQLALRSSLPPYTVADILKARGQTALELLWVLNAQKHFDDESAVVLLHHADPYVRLWTARLLGDQPQVSQGAASFLAQMATTEPNVQVRSQLACTARRLSAAQDISLVRSLALHREDLPDPHIPLLLWWAVESKCEKSADEVLRNFEDRETWNEPIIKEFIIERLARRFAQAGTRQDLLHCAKLFELSPGADFTAKLESGFEEGVKGRPLNGLPNELISAMRKAGVKSETLALRLGDPEAVANARKVIEDPKANRQRRIQLMQVLAEPDAPDAGDLIAQIATRPENPEITKTALAGLQRYSDPKYASTIAACLPKYEADSRLAAINLLATRAAWTAPLLAEIAAGRINPKDVPADIVSKIRVNSPADAAKYWGAEKRQTTGEMQVEIDRLLALLNTGSGSPYEGIKVFTMACATCHRLFGQGGQIGPDLTSFKRDDLPNMLLNIVNPNAEIREGFVNYLLTTKDGRALTGFLADEDKQVVVLRGLDGANQNIARADIQEMKPTGTSLMPEGLLQSLEDQQVRDLFAYLRSAQPLVR